MTEQAKKWRHVPWLRIGAEAVAIITSILIAFSLDAWWDDRQSAKTEQWYLRSLNRDFQENQTGLERTFQVQEAVLQSIRELVLFGGTTTPTPGADSVKSLLAQVLSNTSIGFNPSIGTYRELLNTSSLQVLTSDTLRTLLSEFDLDVQKIGRVEAGAEDSWTTVLNEHLLTRLDLAALVPDPMLGSGTAVERRPSHMDFRSLPRDPVFTNIMVGRFAVTAVRLSMYRDLQATVNEILRVLELELSH